MHSKERNSANVDIRKKEATKQPEAVIEQQTGYGDKKLDGPNRPST